MANYSSHFSTLHTPQTEGAEPNQVKNSAGGYTFGLDKWAKLDRWLILGAEGGTYYASERKLTIENANVVIECLNEDGPRTVAVIASVSDSGRAPKNDPAIFALAIAAGHKDPNTRKLALAELTAVCRTGTHLFQFVEAVKGFRGWGRGLRRAVANWYVEKSPQKLAYQVLKYQNRNGWSHRDVLRMCHAELPVTHQGIARWVVGHPSNSERIVKKNGLSRIYHATPAAPVLLEAYEELKAATDENTVVSLILRHGFTHEMIPNQWKNSPQVWAALRDKMPIGATVRNLGKMTSVGLLAPLSLDAERVCEQLTSLEAIKNGRLHPLSILSALKVYSQGHGEKGKLTWSPNQQIVDALDSAFYLSFDAVEPTNKRLVLALDVSGSMDWYCCAGTPGVTPKVASAALAMVTVKTEKNYHILGFSGRLVDIPISPRMRLDTVIRVIERIPMGRTDCALPMLWAAGNSVNVDAFQVYTDNETYAGAPHPHQALRAYRNKQSVNAKLAVVGMTATGFSIADPNDAGMLDVVGLDTATPAIIADFIRS